MRKMTEDIKNNKLELGKTQKRNDRRKENLKRKVTELMEELEVEEKWYNLKTKLEGMQEQVNITDTFQELGDSTS